MSYSTDDCKNLLDSDPATAGTNQGPWKRLSKRNGLNGVERIFSDKAGGRFAKIVESATGLAIAAVGNALDDVDSAAATSAKTGGKASSVLHRVEHDPIQQALAEEIMAQIEDDGGIDPQEPRYKDAGLALANRWRFGLCVGSEEEEMWVSFVPDTWITQGNDFGVPDFEPPIGHLMPFPELSETPNGSGDWIVGGFEQDPKGCIRALLDHGFVWDQRVQDLVQERSQDEHSGWVTDWVRKGAKLTAKKARKEVTENDFPQVQTMAEFNQKLASSPSSMLFLPYPNTNASPDFWWELNSLGKQCGLPLTRIVPDSEVAKALVQANGHVKPDQWHFVFFQGNKRRLDLEGMFTPLFHNLVKRHLGAAKKPKP